MSRVGKRPVEIPKGVKVLVETGRIKIEGPKGKLEFMHHPRMKVGVEDNKIVVTRSTDAKLDTALHGTTRSIVNNMIKGVTDGFTRQLEIVGVGFKGQVEGKNLVLNLGFSHPINFDIPDGITIETPKPTIINIKGIDKKLVGEVAAKIRDFYRPEPYKGKGIRYAGEYVRKKVGKKVA